MGKKLTLEQKERIEKKKQEWVTSGHHSGLMSVT